MLPRNPHLCEEDQAILVHLANPWQRGREEQGDAPMENADFDTKEKEGDVTVAAQRLAMPMRTTELPNLCESRQAEASAVQTRWH